MCHGLTGRGGVLLGRSTGIRVQREAGQDSGTEGLWVCRAESKQGREEPLRDCLADWVKSCERVCLALLEERELYWGLPCQHRGKAASWGLPGQEVTLRPSSPLLLSGPAVVVLVVAAGGEVAGARVPVEGRAHVGMVSCAGSRVARGCELVDSVASCLRLVAMCRTLLCRLTSLLPKNDGCPQPLKNTSACCEGEYFQAEGSGWILSRRRRRRGSPGGAKKAMGASSWPHSCSLVIHLLVPLIVRES